MFKKKQSEPSELTKVITKVHSAMDDVEPASEDFAKMTAQLDKLYKMDTYKEPKVNMNTVLAVGGNLAGILIIIGYEKFNVIGTKALGLIGKFK